MNPEWIDMIFTKLSLVYGRDFLGRWEGLDLNDVKSDWAHELAGMSADAIAYVLKNLPASKAPTVLEFREISRRRPPPEFKALPVPAADREKVQRMLNELRLKIGVPRVGS